MENYTKFLNFFKEFKNSKQLGMTESFGNSGDNFISNIDNIITKSKIFEMSDSVKKMLLLTTPPKINIGLKLPFSNIFIDVKLTQDELNKLGYKCKYKEIIGILISEGYFLSEKDNSKMGTNFRITICSIQLNNEVWFDTYNENINIPIPVKILKNEYTDKNAKKVCYYFLLNFLNFLYNPEIEYVDLEYSPQMNQKRIQKGKLPIPSRRVIRVTGVLKDYVNKLESGDSFKLTHRFWVRGHYRTLKNKKVYKSKVGTRVWIYPFIKGQGVLINKSYSLNKRKEVN